ncbi:hypothetical protein OF117_10085 [Geodermatophilus sp. YIM 151500]|uniref:DUF6779 domain-containing protein n=1 Tax=Geodermatophilus sp. YIM 151500 TaxID=2984531 RepID=UPI0021E3D131|nr:DUF6779 domain-containing protein [Geodermatophilus sp. YIM 151500]MCV2489712.1 hypothetical protein [Geodermatophilus sp. YIM 151500]
MPRRQDDDVSWRAEGDRPSRGSRLPSSPRALLLAAGCVLAACATLAVFLTDNPQLLRVAVVAAGWAFVLATFAAGRRRADQEAAAEREAELHRVYERELDREVTARRQYELELESDLRRQTEGALRTQLDSLRADLAKLGELREEVAQVSGLREDVARLTALRDEVGRISALRDDVAELTALRSDVAALAGLRDDVNALTTLRAELGQIEELRADVARLRTEIVEQLSSEMLVERIVMRTQASRLPTSGEQAPLDAGHWDDEPPRELTGGWPAVRLDEPHDVRTEQYERVRAHRPVPPLPWDATPSQAWQEAPPRPWVQAPRTRAVPVPPAASTHAAAAEPPGTATYGAVTSAPASQPPGTATYGAVVAAPRTDRGPQAAAVQQEGAAPHTAVAPVAPPPAAGSRPASAPGTAAAPVQPPPVDHSRHAAADDRTPPSRSPRDRAGPGRSRHAAAETLPPLPPGGGPRPLETPLEWLARRDLVDTPSARPAGHPADPAASDLPPRRRRGDEDLPAAVGPDDLRTTEHRAARAAGSATAHPFGPPLPAEVGPPVADGASPAGNGASPPPGHGSPPAGHDRLARILAENGVRESTGGRRRRRYREEDQPDDVLSRVLRGG